MSETLDHIDQLKEWWETAEVPTATSLPRVGDRIIVRYNSEWYEIATADDDAEEGDLSENIRILTRAPKPKPAWHDAPAVIASTNLAERQVWERDEGGTYCGTAGDVADDYELRDVTPLIEAKVTDEMIDRILDVIAARFDNYPAGTGEELALAALGLETE